MLVLYACDLGNRCAIQISKYMLILEQQSILDHLMYMCMIYIKEAFFRGEVVVNSRNFVRARLSRCV